MKKMPEKGMLCCITPEEGDPVAYAEKALAGGADMIQLRRKNASGRELCEWSVRLQEICQRHGALFIVNDRLDIALASDADGVHLGQEDVPAAAARTLLGKDKILGVSTSSAEEAAQAVKDGADYIGFGHIYPTPSKLKPREPAGTALLRTVAGVTAVPVVAIGGITEENIAEVTAAGAYGAAVISAVSGAADPASAVRRLRQKIRAALP